MKKKETRKLQLLKETLQKLEEANLRFVLGGEEAHPGSCCTCTHHCDTA